jgi:hypothetical protein
MESKLCKRRSDKTKATFENITLTRTGGKHGGGEILAQMGEFLDSYCKPKTNRLIYCWRQHLEEVENAINF